MPAQEGENVALSVDRIIAACAQGGQRVANRNDIAQVVMKVFIPVALVPGECLAAKRIAFTRQTNSSP